MVIGSATGLHDPMTTSKGIAAASAGAWPEGTDPSANRAMGSGPASGTKRSSSSASASTWRAASASSSGDAVEVTVRAIRRRTAWASSSLPSPLQGLAVDIGGPPSGSAIVAAERVR